ncbi:MAG: hypothetical protein PWR01_3312 [Clostridiales bacterium]|nr:hypothetical protein [Clostridiales bacterium]MDN5282239.1 hypothetical protein [Candidatus Ozemobacter sp.]
MLHQPWLVTMIAETAHTPIPVTVMMMAKPVALMAMIAAMIMVITAMTRADAQTVHVIFKNLI